MHRGPGMRTSRTRALEIGTERSNFPQAVDYHAQGGHPVMAGMGRGTYAAKPQGVALGKSPKFQMVPFKLGG